MNPALWLDRAATLHPDRPAIYHGTDLVADYARFRAMAQAAAGALRVQGLVPGDRVALFAKNDPLYLVALYAIWQAGCVAVPINAKLHPREAAFILDNSGARAAFTDQAAALAPLCPDVALHPLDAASLASDAPVTMPHRFAPQDTIWLFYTSGTTGRPKGVMIPARAVELMTLTYFVDVDPVGPEDAILYAAPMSHGAGIYNFMHVLRGARHVMPKSGGFGAIEVLELAQAHGNISMFAAPTMVKRLVDQARVLGFSGKGIKTIVYGGGPMYVADIEAAVDQFGPRFVQIYGQGEAPMAISALSREEVVDRAHPRWRARLASVGRAQSPVELRILRADGSEAAVDEPGEICVRSGLVMTGYWQNPEATATTLVDGWLRTGDLGALDADGYLTLKDRSKDVIISGGTNIYPREVEEALLLHADVAEVSVVGRPDPEWGEVVVAFVVPSSGAMDEVALDAHCRDHIARFKRPKAYVAVTELPKNNYGKVLKTALRDKV